MIGRAVDALTAAASEAPPDVTIERLPEGIRLTGPGLLRRWAADPRLHHLVADAARRMR
ncbi:hypothetical protein [Sphingomonas sp.]|uniref:hypothetical protein n=1 Tax=Sphingomonas sp. TaxID=28214 RepID=UPI003B3B2800